MPVLGYHKNVNMSEISCLSTNAQEKNAIAHFKTKHYEDLEMSTFFWKVDHQL